MHFSICCFDENEIVAHVLMCIPLIPDEAQHPMLALFFLLYDFSVSFVIFLSVICLTHL